MLKTTPTFLLKGFDLTPLIQPILISPILFFVPYRLFIFFEDVITHNQIVHFCPHKTFVRILRGAYYRFTSYIEARINNYSITYPFFKCTDEFMIFGIGLLMNGLHPCRIVKMGY